jgi:Ca2+-transporting ATPase
VLHLEPGDSIPADGVLISGHGVKCDESSVTGESDHMKKTNGYDVWQQIIEGRANKNLDHLWSPAARFSKAWAPIW